jgi:hypothetical protein
MNFTRMTQLSLGVVDAVPFDRRPAMAEQRLMHLAEKQGFVKSPSTPRHELREPAAEVIAQLEKLYNEGLLDEALCDLPPSSAGAGPNVLISRRATPGFLDIGAENYMALAVAAVEALTNWARVNPVLDAPNAREPRRGRGPTGQV